MMTRRSLRIWRDTVCETALFVRALLLLPAIAIAVRYWGFSRVERIASRPRRAGRRAPFGTARQVIQTMEAAARYAPGATCLVQAMALKVMMTRRGIITALHIGTARGPLGDLIAHAWVEGDAWTAPCGSSDVQAFARLPPRERPPS